MKILLGNDIELDFSLQTLVSLKNLDIFLIFIGSYVSCGDKKLYPTCSHCESGNVSSLDVWCNGNCGLDADKIRCIEEGNYS